MTKEVDLEVCPELAELNRIATNLANDELPQDLEQSLNDYLVVTLKLNESVKAYNELQSELVQFTDELNSIKRTLSFEESTRSLLVNGVRAKLYEESLKPALVKLKEEVNKYYALCESEENLRASVEGVKLIVKSFEDALASLGVHQKEEQLDTQETEKSEEEK
ncbi:hypothetical protein CKF54_06780 [Psittacicella hinzii]|uniref:Uncharacterized protein n=1 Tax=Psittacicella hinzii TaxID=2028575 RepID=A0A3A1Y5M9_9GAMM|nr:hypothetical protein [Psittacicella hinzii]RIY31364.1 hypothetical protein CKF54_06780 [Psittacicella hinzii]